MAIGCVSNKLIFKFGQCQIQGSENKTIVHWRSFYENLNVFILSFCKLDIKYLFFSSNWISTIILFQCKTIILHPSTMLYISPLSRPTTPFIFEDAPISPLDFYMIVTHHLKTCLHLHWLTKSLFSRNRRAWSKKLMSLFVTKLSFCQALFRTCLDPKL